MSPDGESAPARRTTVESFDRRMIVNARASWQLTAAFAPQATDGGSIVALTSDHTAFNLPDGASKGAFDRVVLAAARELGDRGQGERGQPGTCGTGWMDDGLREAVTARQPTGQLGTPADVVGLVSFRLSDDGTWTTGRPIHTDGGFSAWGWNRVRRRPAW